MNKNLLLIIKFLVEYIRSKLAYNYKIDTKK